jgi:BTB/POZ domain-containing protein 1/2
MAEPTSASSSSSSSGDEDQGSTGGSKQGTSRSNSQEKAQGGGGDPEIPELENSAVDLPQNRLRRGVVCEAWQSTKSCLKERISYLYNNDILSDISFLVGRSRVKIPGHKFVLAIGSPVFDAMFNGPLALQETEKIVELPDVEPEAFYALLKVCNCALSVSSGSTVFVKCTHVNFNHAETIV